MKFINEDREQLYRNHQENIDMLTLRERNRLIKLIQNPDLSLEKVQQSVELYFETLKYEGVTYNVVTDRFRAVLRQNRKLLLNDYFDNIDDAINARKEAEQKYLNTDSE